MKDFRDLIVWRKAHLLTLAAYEASAGFPRQELFGISSQVRRCAASIAANIAEGCGKCSHAEFQRFWVLRPVRRVSWNIISCWRMILASWTPGRMRS
jgi:hypothetical protein